MRSNIIMSVQRSPEQSCAGWASAASSNALLCQAIPHTATQIWESNLPCPHGQFALESSKISVPHSTLHCSFPQYILKSYRDVCVCTVHVNGMWGTLADVKRHNYTNELHRMTQTNQDSWSDKPPPPHWEKVVVFFFNQKSVEEKQYLKPNESVRLTPDPVLGDGEGRTPGSQLSFICRSVPASLNVRCSTSTELLKLIPRARRLSLYLMKNQVNKYYG